MTLEEFERACYDVNVAVCRLLDVGAVLTLSADCAILRIRAPELDDVSPECGVSWTVTLDKESVP